MDLYLPWFPSTFIIVGIIVIYCAILALARQFKKFNLKDEGTETYLPFVNIYIPAHNEETVIEDTLENLAQIDYPKYNILVMDDRSKDRTAELAQKIADKYPEKMKVFTRPYDAVPGKSAVLNDALKMTEGEIICIFDADAKVKPDFLTNIIPYLKGDDIGAVQARKVISNKDDNILTACQYFEYCMDADIQMGRDSLKAATELRGNGELVKRQALVDINGWNVNTLTDDLDMSTRLNLAGYFIRFCPVVKVYEEAIGSVKQVIKQRRRWAEGSIRRYLDSIVEIFKTTKQPLRVSLDQIAYFSEFVLPIWLISDVVLQVATGGISQLIVNLIVLAVIGLFFIIMLFDGIIKYENCSVFEALRAAIITSVFITIIWTIVVSFVFVKIIFTKRKLDWFKTDRIGTAK